MRVWSVAVIGLMLMSGCLTNDSSSEPDFGNVAQSVEDAAMPYLSQNHGGDTSLHHDASLHAGSKNVRLVGYHNGFDNSGNANNIPTGVYYTELAVQGDYVYLAKGSVPREFSQSGVDDMDGGFVILDVSDPATPSFVGEFHTLTGGDIEVNRDGTLAFFTTQRNSIEEIAGNLKANEDRTQPAPRGIHIVDISDKTAPESVGFQPFLYNGPHTVSYHEAGAREYLIVQTYDFYANSLPSTTVPNVAPWPEGVFPATQRVSVFEIVPAPVDDRSEVGLVQVAQFQILDNPPQGKLFFPHDAVPQVHPLTGKTYLYVAYWDLGVRLVDITDLPSMQGVPTGDETPRLEEIGAYSEFSPSARNNIHLAKPFDELIDGRHITVAEPEIINANETGQITFIDTTAPRKPHKVAPTSYWSLPGELIVNNLDFSPHNFDTFDGKVALAHNHAGLWIIDVHDAANLEDPKSAGFFMDVQPRIDAPRYQPYFWGVFEHEGLLYASDESSGLYVLEYTGP